MQVTIHDFCEVVHRKWRLDLCSMIAWGPLVIGGQSSSPPENVPFAISPSCSSLTNSPLRTPRISKIHLPRCLYGSGKIKVYEKYEKMLAYMRDSDQRPRGLRLVGWLYWGFTSLKRYFSHIATWKQEITNLWNSSGEAENRTPDLLLRKPRV